MNFPSWLDLTEKISEFDQSANIAIGKTVQSFQDKHPLGDKAVKTLISVLPPPFNAIAENIYRTSEGSDEEKLEKIKEFLGTIQKQGEDHYNNLSAKSDTIIQEVLNLQDIAAKESTLQLVMKMMVAQSDATIQQLEQINESLTKIQMRQVGGDQIGCWIRGDNNIIGKNISVVNQEIKLSGLTLLEIDYFERRKNVKVDFEDWKKGYPFELPSIYYGYEFRRKNVTDEIKQKLEANNKLLMLGESGTSKSTLLMETMCDYYKNGYKVLHNLDSTRLPQANDIVQYIEPLVKGKNKLLIAIDNVHDKKMSTIFNVINQLSFIDNSKDVLFLLTGRLPEYDILVNKKKFELDDQDRIALNKFNEGQDIKYQVPYFKNSEEVEQFFTFYKTKYTVEKSSPKSYLDIFNETGGQPIMIKFFLLGKGLGEDVQNRYKFYLLDSESKKPIDENIHTMLICALFSISNYRITDKILDVMKIRKYARSIIGILHRKEDGTWTTIHSRWDMELFSYLFSSKDEDEIDDRKANLENTCTAIFDLRDVQFSLSIISALYSMAGESRIPINIVNDAVRIPEYISIDKDVMYSVHAYDKAGAYYNLKMYNEMLFESDEALRMNQNEVGPLSNKGIALYNLGKHQEAIEQYDEALKVEPNDFFVLSNKALALYNLGKYEEAIEWYDQALEVKPNDIETLSNKALSLSNLGRYEEAIEWFDKIQAIDPNFVDALYNKGSALDNLGKYEEAIGSYDKALEINPNDVETLSNKALALYNLGKYEEAIGSYDKALEIDPNDVETLSNKALALYNLGKYEEAIEWYDKVLKINPNDVNSLDNKSYTLFKLDRTSEAIQFTDKAVQLDPSYGNAWYNRSCYMVYIGEINEALKNLEEAIRFDKSFIDSAKTDKDFDSIRNDERFKELMGNCN